MTDVEIEEPFESDDSDVERVADAIDHAWDLNYGERNVRTTGVIIGHIEIVDSVEVVKSDTGYAIPVAAFKKIFLSRHDG